jgi:micrococcal nuclease
MSTTVPYTRRESWLLAIGVTLAVLAPLAIAGGFLLWIVLSARGGETDFLGNPHDPEEYSTPRVTEVVDGDTIVVRLMGDDLTVRLLGIDTPETKDPRREVQCFGEEASRHTAELLPPGTAVRLEGDVEPRDRYDRLLAYVYRSSDDLFVNLDLARGGYADLLTYPPNVAHSAELSAAVAEARREQRGLWQACGGPGRPA